LDSLVRLVRHLSGEHLIDPSRIYRHGDLKNTLCPGKRLPWEALRKQFQTSQVSSLSDLFIGGRGRWWRLS
jgi:N-acetyl-anhydromuramyl-L-alanine amidase AmpD